MREYLPMSLHVLLQDRGSHTRSTFSVLPLTTTVPAGFMAKLYMEFLLPGSDVARKYRFFTIKTSK